jgi:hypothetical protein
MGFVVGEMAMGQVFLKALKFPVLIIIPVVLNTHTLSGADTAGTSGAPVQGVHYHPINATG